MFLTPARERWAADLRWLFRESAGAIGQRSNFGAMVASLESGRGGGQGRTSYDVDDRALQAAERVRHIGRTLDGLPVWARVVLALAYRAEDGELRLVGALTSTADRYRRSSTKHPVSAWLQKTRDSQAETRRRIWAMLRAEAADLLGEAVDLYAAAARRIE